MQKKLFKLFVNKIKRGVLFLDQSHPKKEVDIVSTEYVLNKLNFYGYFPKKSTPQNIIFYSKKHSPQFYETL